MSFVLSFTYPLGAFVEKCVLYSYTGDKQRQNVRKMYKTQQNFQAEFILVREQFTSPKTEIVKPSHLAEGRACSLLRLLYVVKQKRRMLMCIHHHICSRQTS